MNLLSLTITNVGPIEKFALKPEFKGEQPLPIVIVGPNGSGKSTVLSFIVNALVSFKQQVFEKAEIEQNRVYRMRGGLFLRAGAHYYQSKLEFAGGLSAEEWVLDRSRKDFEAAVTPLPADEGWKAIQPDNDSFFRITPATKGPFNPAPNAVIKKIFDENVVQFFPADRFEPPDWLNQQSLSPELKFPEGGRFVGFTDRRIFSRSLLKPTLEWIQDVAFDWMLAETHPVVFPNPAPGAPPLQAFVRVQGRNGMIIDAVTAVLGAIFDGTVHLTVQQRQARQISATITTASGVRYVPNLLGLSAGQSALFCLFCNVIRDFDLSAAPLTAIADIKGIVVVDEVDLHLHMDLQYRVLPRLMRLFPKVQFIVTGQSPFVVLGMKEEFGEDGFSLIQVPDGRRISAESFSEFRDAFKTFRRTSTFERQLIEQLRATAKTVVLCEGPTDATHLNTAWSKLYPTVDNPFQIIGCGGDTKVHRGGAKTLKALLEALPWFERRTIIGLFDNDRAGAEQFNSLAKADFNPGETADVRVHRNGSVKAVLIPTPLGREMFAPSAIRTRMLEVEHYYSDEVLNNYGLVGESLYGSPVFEIVDSLKRGFSDAVVSLDAKEFISFDPLFAKLKKLCDGAPAPAEEASVSQTPQAEPKA